MANGCAVCADDKFRDRFLWGRRPMLATVAAKLPKATGNVWVDLGGGTGVCSPLCCSAAALCPLGGL